MSVFPATATIRRSGEVPTLPHGVKLAGPLRALRWPQICVCCGATAGDRLPVTTVFNRDWRFAPTAQSVDYFRLVVVRTLDVPACDACVRRHRAEARPAGVLGTWLSLVSTVFVVPFLVAALAVMLYFFPDLLGSAGALVSGPRTTSQAAVFALAAALFAAAAWHQTRPRRVTPPTVVTSTFDFSDNLAGIAGVEHRVYGMANEQFARAFQAANVDRLWTDELRARGTRRQAIVAALLAAAVLVALLAIFLR